MNETMKKLETFGKNINTESEVITLEEAIKRNYEVDEKTQRGYILKPEEQSLMILSTLLNFIYSMLSISSGKIEDGQQRFLTLKLFVKGAFPLTFKSKKRSVTVVKNILRNKFDINIEELEGLYFEDLSDELKNRIMNTKVVINDTKSDDEGISSLLFSLINSNLNPVKKPESYKANYDNPFWLKIIDFRKNEAEKHPYFGKFLTDDSRLAASEFIASLIQLSLKDTKTGQISQLSSTLLSSKTTTEEIEKELNLCSKIFDLISSNENYLSLCKKRNGRIIAKNRFFALYWTILSDFKTTRDWDFLTMNSTAENLNDYVNKIFDAEHGFSPKEICDKKETYNLNSKIDLDTISQIRDDMVEELGKMRRYAGRKIISSVVKAPMKAGVL